MRGRELDFLRSQNIDDLPWKHTRKDPQNGFEYYNMSFPGTRINGIVTTSGELSMGMHRDPGSTYYNIGRTGSELGHQILTEARVKLGLPIKPRMEKK